MTDDAKKYDEERWGNQDNRYWIEEIKSDWTPFVYKSDVLDYDKILYVLHDNQAFEDYPVAISSNVNLLMGLCDRLNEYEIEVQQLKKESNKIKTLLFQKIKELNDDYEKSAKAGMPTGGIIGELDSFEEICEEMGWSKVSALGVESTLMYYNKGEKND